jgi:hypothetical protein
MASCSTFTDRQGAFFFFRVGEQAGHGMYWLPVLP